MRQLPVGGALLPLNSSGCRNPRLFEDGFTVCVRKQLEVMVTAGANQVMVMLCYVMVPIQHPRQRCRRWGWWLSWYIRSVGGGA
jgi:hypothetical protein